MKIFQIITVSEYGGAQSIVANLLQKMNEDVDNEVYIIYGGNGEAWKDLDERIHRINISEHRKEISIKDVCVIARLIYLRFKFKPDIVHLHSSKMGALGRFIFSKKKIIYTIHGFDSIRIAFRKFLFIEKMLKNRAARIVGVSKYDTIRLKEEGIINNVSLVYNGLKDDSENKELETDPVILQGLEKIKESYPKIVMCISRISKQKKFDLFLDIAEAMPEYAFVWIGNKEEIKDIPTNAFCLGEAHAASVYLKYADLFILPSNYEGLPVSILEALSFSVPVVASSVGGVVEILDGTNGYAVDNSVEEFKDKIQSILSDEQVQERMSLAARKSYVDNFTIDKMVDGYRTIYKQVVEK